MNNLILLNNLVPLPRIIGIIPIISDFIKILQTLAPPKIQIFPEIEVLIL
jgi:hypothetical protein